ncbi:efflux RND transporter periplasmic adaptor subunit [Azospirillum halopraeferens]|uniref:efflux RND transporter periplasmic adaptor subunit n=1 Tax=Azospirillum halopraeferens TaxID=34010 RepID=UPI0003F5000B|nr:HlyD family efflux transporter periplasmic adaptor subunit [Azospirillum halopraeferens]
MRAGVRRALAILAVVLPVAAGLVYLFRPQPVPVDLVTAAHGPMEVTVDDQGWTRVRDLYVVSAPVDGRIRRVDVRAGDAVTGGAGVVATIEPADPSFLDVRSRVRAEAEVAAAEAALALADAEVARAQAELGFARAELDRAAELARTRTASPRALDLATLDVATREAALATAEAERRVRHHQLTTARAALIDPAAAAARAAAGEAVCCLPVTAPVDGQVLRVLTESEGVVTAGTPIVEIGDTGDLEVVVPLLSTDAVRVAPGAPVRIVRWGGEEELAGRVRRVEPYGFTKVSALGVEEQRVNVIIDLTDPPGRRASLGHGFRVEVRIVVRASDDALMLPAGALFRDGDRWAVFAATGGRAELRHVTVGLVNERAAEIRDGLEAGTPVVLHPGDRVADGVPLVARTGG